MNGKLRIFVAGAKNLKTERDSIKALANDLNSRYISKGISVIAHSYEHFEDDQQVYNDFIENKADIIIFIVDGMLGDKTKEELYVATNSYNKTNHPKVMVFMREQGKDVPAETIEAQRIVGERLGHKYYIEYKDITDLKYLAKDRIVRYVDDNIDAIVENKIIKNTTHTIQGDSICKKKINIYRFFTCLSLVIIIGTYFWHKAASKNLLLFVGGGSVKNYLMYNYDSLDVQNYNNSVNIDLASGNAWRVLFEEANHHLNDKEKPNRFIVVCLSANRINDTLVIEHLKNMDGNKLVIVEAFLGYDTLSVRINKNLRKVLNDNSIELSKQTIDTQTLYGIIKFVQNNPDKTRIFTTNKASGTLECYKNTIKKIDSIIDLDKMIDKKKINIFYDGTNSNIAHYGYDNLGVKSFVILGSQNYSMKSLDEAADKEDLLLIDAEGNYVKKPMYLYFIAYQDQTNENIYHVDNRIIRFLKRLDTNDTVWTRFIHNKTINFNDVENKVMRIKHYDVGTQKIIQ